MLEDVVTQWLNQLVAREPDPFAVYERPKPRPFWPWEWAWQAGWAMRPRDREQPQR